MAAATVPAVAAPTDTTSTEADDSLEAPGMESVVVPTAPAVATTQAVISAPATVASAAVVAGTDAPPPAAEGTDGTESTEVSEGTDLSNGWVTVADQETGDPYYWNKESGEVSWELPANCTPVPLPPQVEVAVPAATPGGYVDNSGFELMGPSEEDLIEMGLAPSGHALPAPAEGGAGQEVGVGAEEGESDSEEDEEVSAQRAAELEAARRLGSFHEMLREKGVTQFSTWEKFLPQ